MTTPGPPSASAIPALDAATVLSIAADIVWATDAEQRLIYLSDGFERVTGYPAAAALGHRARDLPWFGGNQEEVAARSALFDARQPLRDMRYPVIRRDGSTRLLSLSGGPRFDAAGTFVGYAGITVDVTESARGEEMLARIADTIGRVTGSDYCRGLVRAMCETLPVDMVYLGRLVAGRIETVAVHTPAGPAADFAYDPAGMPCAAVIAGELGVHGAGLGPRFPTADLLRQWGAEAYIGAPLRASDGATIGLLVVLRRAPMIDIQFARNLVQVFAGRAAAELERQAVVAELVQSRDYLLHSQRLGRTGYIITDLIDGHVTWSDTMFEIRGVAPRPWFNFEEARGFIHPEDQPVWAAARDAAVATGQPYDIEVRVIRPDGGIIWEQSIGHPQFDAQGRLQRLVVFVQDVTERHAADEEQRKLALVASRTGNLVVVTDARHDIEWVNEAFTRITGHSFAEARGRKPRDVLLGPHADPAVVALIHDRLESGEGVRDYELPCQARDGRRFWLNFEALPIRDASGRVVRHIGIGADVTTQKEAERQLADSRHLLLESQRLGRIGYLLSDQREGRVYWSDTMFELAGIPPQPHLTLAETLRHFAPEDAERYFAARDAAVRERRNFTLDVTLQRPDGVAVSAHGVGHPSFDADGELTGILVVLQDVTARKDAELALRRSEERFRALIELSSDLVAVVDADGTLRYHSPSVAEQSGFAGTEFVGRSILDLVHREDTDAIVAAVAQIAQRPGEPISGESRVRHRDGSWRRIAWTARNAMEVPGVGGIIVNGRDVTAARTLEEQLVQAQKMEAIGQLAGGIAHDFNNIIAVILGFASFLLEDLPAGSRLHGFAGRIAGAGTRAKDLVQQILAFSRQAGVAQAPADIGVIVQETVELLRGSLPSSTELQVSAPGGLTAVVNAGQIGQVLMNLCINANDALMNEPGTIRIGVDLHAAGVAMAVPPPDQGLLFGRLDPSRAHVRLSVADTGCGMPPEVLRRIYDPFFTTKERGRGTGLGLPVVQGIVVAAGGACLATSRPGQGSRFDILLPLVEDAKAANESVAPAPVVRGSERVLLVDDEVDVTDMLSTGLNRLGYEVGACNDALQALRTIAEAPDVWDVVITDQVMPQMKGTALVGRLKQLKPALRCILCTGFSDGTTEASARAAGVDAFFLKPVSPERLAASIRELVEPPRQA